MNVMITGGAGFTGTVLVERLLAGGNAVTVLDRMVYGSHLPAHPKLRVVRGDVRDRTQLRQTLPGHDALIHLAFISNDPDREIDPALSRAINGDAFVALVEEARFAGIRRFIFPSSCSVYGHSGSDAALSEKASVHPLTAYGEMKVECERILLEQFGREGCAVILRPATVCGVSPRQRLDLTVNRMATEAVHRRHIRVRNPDSIRPGIHIADLARAYQMVLQSPEELVRGEVFNLAYENLRTRQIAATVREVAGSDVTVSEENSSDLRTYSVSSAKAHQTLGFAPEFTIRHAIHDLMRAFSSERYRAAMSTPDYYNIEMEKRHDWSMDWSTAHTVAPTV